MGLATDYDGTIAREGNVAESTLAALKQFRAAGRRLVLVTGRQLEDLRQACTELELFDRVVAENGAVLFDPARKDERLLAAPPPVDLVLALQERGVEPLSVGRVIVATSQPYETTVLTTIRDLGLEHQIVFNKGAVMVLPAGVDKASGLRAALAELDLSPEDVVGVGDAENDYAFVNACGCTVAVQNAVESLSCAADWVTPSPAGAGVEELIARLLGGLAPFSKAQAVERHGASDS